MAEFINVAKNAAKNARFSKTSFGMSALPPARRSTNAKRTRLNADAEKRAITVGWIHPRLVPKSSVSSNANSPTDNVTTPP